MQTDERFEFAYEGQTGYFIVTRDVLPVKGDRIGLIKVDAPAGTLAFKKKNPDARTAAQVAWQRDWHPPVIQQAAENILEAAKEKAGAEPRSVDFTGQVNNGKLIVQRQEKAVSFKEQFAAGIGVEVLLPVKPMKKLAGLILGIELPSA